MSPSPAHGQWTAAAGPRDGEPTPKLAGGQRSTGEAGGGRPSPGSLQASDWGMGSGGAGWLAPLMLCGLGLAGLAGVLALRSRWSAVGSLAGQGAIELLDRKPVSPTHAVLLVRVGGRLVLLSSGREGVTRLADWSEAEAACAVMPGGEAAGESAGPSLTAVHVPPGHGPDVQGGVG